MEQTFLPKTISFLLSTLADRALGKMGIDDENALSYGSLGGAYRCEKQPRMEKHLHTWSERPTENAAAFRMRGNYLWHQVLCTPKGAVAAIAVQKQYYKRLEALVVLLEFW